MSKPQFSCTGKDIINEFRKDLRAKKDHYKLENTKDSDLRAALKLMNVIFLEALIEDGSVKFGETLGFIEIRKKKRDMSKINHAVKNYQKMKETGKVAFEFNSHSDGYIFETIWNRAGSKTILADKRLWRFKVNRDFKRKVLCPLIRAKKVDYPEIDPIIYKRKKTQLTA